MDSVNLGISGLGRGFMLTLPMLRADPRVRLAAAFDPRNEAVERFAGEFDAAGHATFESLVDDSGVDAIYVASPHELHAEQTIAALSAGKHVLVEKPMAPTVADCARMAACADAVGKVLVVGPSHGFDAQVCKAAELVASGRHGAVRMVTALNFTDFMYRPRRPEELDEARGGGVVYSQAAHQIDVVRRIVGQQVAQVRGSTGNWDPARGSAGAYTAMLTFAGGAVASLTYSGYAHYDSDELVGWIGELGRPKGPSCYGEARRKLASLSREDEIRAKLERTYGADGQIEDRPAPHHEHFGFVLVSCEQADLKVLPTGIEIYANEARSFLPLDPPVAPRADVVEEFLVAIAGTRPALHNGRWGLDTMACCAALIESSRAGTDIEPDTMIPEKTGEDYS